MWQIDNFINLICKNLNKKKLFKDIESGGGLRRRIKGGWYCSSNGVRIDLRVEGHTSTLARQPTMFATRDPVCLLFTCRRPWITSRPCQATPDFCLLFASSSPIPLLWKLYKLSSIQSIYDIHISINIICDMISYRP